MPRVALNPAELAPSSRYRLGHRDDPHALKAHNEQSLAWRRARADALWTPALQAQVVDMLCIEPDPAAVMARLGMTVSALYGRMDYDAGLRDAVEAALTEQCAANNYVTAAYPDGACGTPTGYRNGRGRCQACRDAHRGRTT